MSYRNDHNVYVTQTEELERFKRSHAELMIAAKNLLETIPTPPTENGRSLFEALRDAIWNAPP
jgi:hypothetical protein